MERRRFTIAAFAGSVLVAQVAGVLMAPPARAAFPGHNGRIAFEAVPDMNFEIFSMNPDGTDQINLTNNPATDASPSWSPDGTKIAFETGRDGDREIYVMNANGSDAVRLTYSSGFDGDPSWSPDGTQILFRSARDGNDEIYVMNADGTNPVRLTNDTYPESSPVWSPDGQHIAFQAEPEANNTDVYTMDPDGQNQDQLTTNPTVDGLPDWLPDGSQILFFSDRDGNREIYSMKPDGSDQTDISNSPSTEDWSPAASPDGTKIVYQVGGFPLHLFVMNADGSGAHQLAGVGETNAGADWQPVASPCRAKNGQSSSSDLQAVIDDASSGDTIFVRGTCVGNFSVPGGGGATSLNLVGTRGASLDGNHSGTVLYVSPFETVAVKRLAITDGDAAAGGGIYNDHGTIRLSRRAQVTGNTATSTGGGIFNDHGTITMSASVTDNMAAIGGAIYNNFGTVTLKGNSRIADNAANSGTVYNFRGTLKLAGHTHVIGNRAFFYGGGIFNVGISEIGRRVQVNSNTAGNDGGGIFNDEGTLQVSNRAQVNGNTALRNGGGIFNAPAAAVTIGRHAQVNSNTAGNDGGGIYNDGGTLLGATAGLNVAFNNPDDIAP